MNKERLELMATLMDEVAADQALLSHFDLKSWVRSNHDDDNEQAPKPLGNRDPAVDLKNELHTCGTTACAVGFATLDKRFRAQGLRMHVASGCSFPCYVGTEGRGGFTGWLAVQKFFDLEYEMADYLFHSDHYSEGKDGPADVAARIRQVLKTNPDGE